VAKKPEEQGVTSGWDRPHSQAQRERAFLDILFVQRVRKEERGLRALLESRPGDPKILEALALCRKLVNELPVGE
jgi:hypothetical protein